MTYRSHRSDCQEFTGKRGVESVPFVGFRPARIRWKTATLRTIVGGGGTPNFEQEYGKREDQEIGTHCRDRV